MIEAKSAIEFINKTVDTIGAMEEADAKLLMRDAGIGYKTLGAGKIRDLIKAGARQSMVDTHNEMVDAYDALPFYKKIDLLDCMIILNFVLVGYLIAGGH